MSSVDEVGSGSVWNGAAPAKPVGEGAEPPPSNRGVPSTTANPFEFRIDWLQGTNRNPTVTVDETRDWLDLLMGGAGFELAPHGRPGYAMVENGAAGAWLAWHPDREDMGTHFCMPAQALSRVVDPDPLRAVRGALAGGYRLTRIDVALDVPAAYLTPARMHAWAREGLLVTRAKGGNNKGGFTLNGGHYEEDGETFYLGSPKSERMLRIYDKQAETGEGPARTRIEFQCRDDAANRLALALLEASDPVEAFLDSLVGFVDVRLQDDPQTERRSRHPEWEAVVVDARSARVAKPPRRPSIEKARNWLRTQLGPTLAVLVAADGGDLGAVLEAIVEGRERWRPSHRQMLIEAAL